MKKDYLSKEFIILELDKDKDLSIEETKRKYRLLARKHHPDKGGSEEKFKEINTAYQKILTYLSHFIELEEEKKEEEENKEEGTYNWYSVSEDKKHKDYLLNKDYLTTRNYLNKYYGIEIEYAYKPFVLYFNVNFKKYIGHEDLAITSEVFTNLELMSMDNHNKLNNVYTKILNNWNTMSKRKKRIYRGMIKTIEKYTNEQ